MEYLNFIKECFDNANIPVTTKKMFGGYGIFNKQKIIGIICENEFYIRVNINSVKSFQIEGRKQFFYEKNNKKMYMKYFLLTEEELHSKQKLECFLDSTY